MAFCGLSRRSLRLTPSSVCRMRVGTQVDSLPVDSQGECSTLPPRLDMAMEVAEGPQPFSGFHCFKGTGTEDFAGEVTRPRMPQLANLLDVPDSASSPGKQ